MDYLFRRSWAVSLNRKLWPNQSDMTIKTARGFLQEELEDAFATATTSLVMITRARHFAPSKQPLVLLYAASKSALHLPQLCYPGRTTRTTRTTRPTRPSSNVTSSLVCSTPPVCSMRSLLTCCARGGEATWDFLPS